MASLTNHLEKKNSSLLNAKFKVKESAGKVRWVFLNELKYEIFLGLYQQV